MITTIASIVGFALLFAVGALLRPRPGCGGNCGACGGGSCSLDQPREDPHD